MYEEVLVARRCEQGTCKRVFLRCARPQEGRHREANHSASKMPERGPLSYQCWSFRVTPPFALEVLALGIERVERVERVLVKLKHPTEMTSVWFINTEVISCIAAPCAIDGSRLRRVMPTIWVPDKVSPLSTLIPSTLTLIHIMHPLIRLDLASQAETNISSREVSDSSTYGLLIVRCGHLWTTWWL